MDFSKSKNLCDFLCDFNSALQNKAFENLDTFFQVPTKMK